MNYQQAAKQARAVTRGYMKWGPVARQIARWRKGDRNFMTPPRVKVRAFYRNYVKQYLDAQTKHDAHFDVS